MTIKDNRKFSRCVWAFEFTHDFPGVAFATKTQYCKKYLHKNDGMASKSLYLELVSRSKTIDSGKQADRFYNWVMENLPYGIYSALCDELQQPRTLTPVSDPARVFFRSMPTTTSNLLDDRFCQQSAKAIADTMRYFPVEIYAGIVKRIVKHVELMKARTVCQP
jgi:hypothetical protein